MFDKSYFYHTTETLDFLQCEELLGLAESTCIIILEQTPAEKVRLSVSFDEEKNIRSMFFIENPAFREGFEIELTFEQMKENLLYEITKS